LALAESYVAGPTTPAVREMTFGDLLRKAAEEAPDRLALIAGVPDPALRRQWTYAQLFQEAQRTARALLARFKPESASRSGLKTSRNGSCSSSAPASRA